MNTPVYNGRLKFEKGSHICITVKDFCNSLLQNKFKSDVFKVERNESKQIEQVWTSSSQRRTSDNVNTTSEETCDCDDSTECVAIQSSESNQKLQVIWKNNNELPENNQHAVNKDISNPVFVQHFDEINDKTQNNLSNIYLAFTDEMNKARKDVKFAADVCLECIEKYSDVLTAINSIKEKIEIILKSMDIEVKDVKKTEKSLKEDNLKYLLKTKSFSINTAMVKAIKKKSFNSKKQKELSNMKNKTKENITIQNQEANNPMINCKHICWNIVKCFCSCFMDYKPPVNQDK